MARRNTQGFRRLEICGYPMAMRYWKTFTLTPKGLVFFRDSFLRAWGIVVDDATSLANGAFIGKRGAVLLKTKEYEGRLYTEAVAWRRSARECANNDGELPGSAGTYGVHSHCRGGGPDGREAKGPKGR